jgi:prepilin-type N-terminal cleavage/methylation domain-containing protein
LCNTTSPVNKCSLGFTLAELLISLAILGVIATFTLPKILGGTGSKQNIAIAKEDFATVASLTNDFSYSEGSDFATYFWAHLNATKLCPTNGITEGCRTVATNTNVPDSSTWPTAIMTNGSTIHIYFYSPVYFAFTIDSNGDAGPNALYNTNTNGEVFASWFGNTTSTDYSCASWGYPAVIMPAHRLTNWCELLPQVDTIFQNN